MPFVAVASLNTSWLLNLISGPSRTAPHWLHPCATSSAPSGSPKHQAMYDSCKAFSLKARRARMVQRLDYLPYQ